MGEFELDDQSTALLQRAIPMFEPKASFVLLVESGPDRGKRLKVDGNSPSDAIVGQSPVCDLRLADQSVSRRHVAFDVVAEGLRIRDLGSTNGTFVGGLRVIEALAAGGEVVTIGATSLRIVVEGAVIAPLPAIDRVGGVLGISREMRRLFPLFQRLAMTTIPVLIEGETGTGKEAVAQAVHDSGARASQPFVLFDCTAIAPNLIESELFGHEKGAFTGATSQRRGVFEQADGGTLLIDEIGDLPLDLQAKLLRAIDTGDVRRVGGDRWIHCDARIIAATRRNLEALVQEGRFRDDLFHRLAIGRIALPPLRERKGDVPLLVEHFCRALSASPNILPRARIEEWMAHTWPGNVRELRNAVSRELALGELSTLGDAAPSIPPQSSERAAGVALEQLLDELLPYDQSRARALGIFQRWYIERALRASHGNVQRAAESSGVALRYFQLMRARYRV